MPFRQTNDGAQGKSGELLPCPRVVPPLDPVFRPASLARASYADAVARVASREKVIIGIEKENGLLSRHELDILPRTAATEADTFRYIERTVKFLLWARGGWRIYVGGPADVGEKISRTYSPGGSRAFDVAHLRRVFEKPFEVLSVKAEEVPDEKGAEYSVGGHLDGCRIGFDLGASDYKVAAVHDGEVVYSDEFPWNPKDETDSSYHIDRIRQGLKVAASHLPRVDAIGGSSAGIFIDSRPMAASLFRSIAPERFETDVKPIFYRLRDEWGVPVEVINDGDVTALAGTLSLKKNSLLGIAMGSSEAAGYMDGRNRITGWLNELAFAPVDYSPKAAVDEWSGDRGVGAMYFSQQAVNRLLPAAGISFPDSTDLPTRLKAVQDLMAGGDERARRVFETIGVYLGYAIPHYAEFYSLENVLILGRVTSGEGGTIILERAAAVLEEEFPDLAGVVELHLPDEKSKRVGQAVAAASLPLRTKPFGEPA
jgi:predicted NBD/HSP70 family sugar kinase